MALLIGLVGIDGVVSYPLQASELLPRCLDRKKIRIGVFPQIEESRVRLARVVTIACRSQRSSEAELRRRLTPPAVVVVAMSFGSLARAVMLGGR
jgi:hypothetical protein